jgi:dihydroflavonol-4-reductase
MDVPEAGKTFDEDCWNSTFKSGDYYRSKTLAEQAGWAFAKKNELNFVTINPFMIVGPTLSDTRNTSTDLLVSLCSGGYPMIVPFTWAWVDVREVARAHVEAALNPAAKGCFPFLFFSSSRFSIHMYI